MSGEGMPPANAIETNSDEHNSNHSLGMHSATSSSVTSRRSQIPMDMFPVIRNSNMRNLDADLNKILAKVIKPRNNFVNRLQDCSTNAMHKFLNRFSNTNLQVTALTFASMGPAHFMHEDPEVRQQAMRTIIVARHLKFGTDNLEPPPGEVWTKTDKSHNKSFNPVCTRDKLDEPEETCENPVAVFAATQIMKEVRKIVREMIRHPSIAHDANKPPSSDNSFASTMSGDGRNWSRQQSDSNVTPTLANKTPG